MDKEAIIVLGGMIMKSPDGTWRSMSIEDPGDNFAATNDHLRTKAAAKLFDRQRIFVASGGRGQLEGVPGAPPVAEVVKRELSGEGIPEASILMEDRSGNTLSQLYESGMMISRLSIPRATIVTNEYHVPRIRAMLRYVSELSVAFDGVTIAIVSAEEILLASEPMRWGEHIVSSRSHPRMRERLLLEERGMIDLLFGTYRK